MKLLRIGIKLKVMGFFSSAFVFGVTVVALSALFFTVSSGYAGDSVGKVLKGVTLAGSRQGQSVGFIDIDGDRIPDKIVGAPYASSSSGTGALLVYKGDANGGFSSGPSMLLKGDDNYGFSFVNLGDVDGDGEEDFAVGAINGDGADVSLCGSVTVYKGGTKLNYDKGGGNIIAKLSGESPMDKFGVFISAGDLNGDGIKDLIVGAPFNTNDPAIYQGGAIYVFLAPDFTNKIVLHSSSQNKGLGWSAAAGDINGDNIQDLCISVSGNVICYYGAQNFNPLTDSPDVTIKSASSGFGKALAIVEDLNSDGFGDIVIGAPNAVINGNRDTGSIYLVKGGTGKRTVTVDATSSDLIARIDGMDLFDRFGSSIAIVDDVDSGQKAGIAVGSPMADLDAFRHLAGKIYLFRGDDISVAMTLANAAVFEGFARDQGYGASLAVANNSRLLIGAPRTDSDTGWVSMVDIYTDQAVPGGSGGGSTGSDDGCD
jgi:hypothetical protein